MSACLLRSSCMFIHVGVQPVGTVPVSCLLILLVKIFEMVEQVNSLPKLVKWIHLHTEDCLKQALSCWLCQSKSTQCLSSSSRWRIIASSLSLKRNLVRQDDGMLFSWSGQRQRYSSKVMDCAVEATLVFIKSGPSASYCFIVLCSVTYRKPFPALSFGVVILV